MRREVIIRIRRRIPDPANGNGQAGPELVLIPSLNFFLTFVALQRNLCKTVREARRI